MATADERGDTPTRPLWVAEHATLMVTGIVFLLFALRIWWPARRFTGEVLRSVGVAEALVATLVETAPALIAAALLGMATMSVGKAVEERKYRSVGVLVLLMFASVPFVWMGLNDGVRVVVTAGAGFVVAAGALTVLELAGVQAVSRWRQWIGMPLRYALGLGLAIAIAVSAMAEAELWLPYEVIETDKGLCLGQVLRADMQATAVFWPANRWDPNPSLVHVPNEEVRTRHALAGSYIMSGDPGAATRPCPVLYATPSW